MSDWADEMARKALIVDGIIYHPIPEHLSALVESVSAALRSVERRTAEECIDIVTDSHTMGEWNGDCRRGIRERFQLES